ncbi:MAG: hypothetical protein KGD57_07030 [Candidatus Lokiarchaeota archaeon]|nr:hypothetical protein [Candidatus Lokiarchaeota archaeon]
MTTILRDMMEMDSSQEGKMERMSLQILGLGIVKINQMESEKEIEIIYQKGIGFPMIQNIIELHKKEMFERDRGNSIIPLDEFTIFINYFKHDDSKIVVICMDKKDNTLSYPHLYLFIKQISTILNENSPISTLENICTNAIEIPKAEGISGILIIGSNGSPYFSELKEYYIEEKEIQISGFISALFSFSREIMGINSGAELKDINFGNQVFYMITKNNVIFAYLVEKLNPLLERYMYIIPDEFIDRYKKELEHFSGDITPFHDFSKNVNQYFNIKECE